jgi:DsbC/DsbD-like thiol-disulfide interchange protein
MWELLLVLAVLASFGLVVCSGAAVTAWRRERRRSRLLAERLSVEGHIERLTAQTLQAMRRATREHLRGQR